MDNASTDGSADAVAEEFPQVDLIRLDENVGFAAANNLAAKRAGAPYLLLLNPDTVVLDGAIQKLVAFAEAHPDAGIWGGRTVFGDGTLNPSSCWARSTPWSMFCRGTGLSATLRGTRLFDPEAYGGWRRDTVRRVDIVSGCFFLVRRELWEELEGFDPAFFMYGEEADLCLRAQARGARPMVTPDAEIVHHGGKSERVRADKVVRLLTARMRLVQRHWPRRWRGFGRAMHVLWVLRRHVAWSVLAVLGIGRARDRAATYRDVWNRRKEWTTDG